WIVKGSTRRARRTSWIECPEALLLPSADRRTFGVLGVVADFVLIKRVGNHAEPANQAGFALFENNPHASPTRIGAKSTIIEGSPEDIVGWVMPRTITEAEVLADATTPAYCAETSTGPCRR